MTKIADQDPANPKPYGAQQPRSRTSLVLSVVVYVAWLAFLIAMAILYPAR